jgi:DNA primase
LLFLWRLPFCGSLCVFVRPLPDARASTPLHWRKVPDCEPADFTLLTIPKRYASSVLIKLQYRV